MAILRNKDLRIDSVVKVPDAPSTNTLFDIAFVYLGLTDGDLTLITSQAELDALSLDTAVSAQIGYFDKSFYVLEVSNISTLQSQLDDKLGTKAFMVQFDNALFDDYFTNNITFEGFVAFNTKSASPWLNDTIKERALQEKVIVFSSPSSDDNRLWYSLCYLLNDIKGYPYLQNIINLSLTGTGEYVNKAQRDLLIDANISFSMQSTDQGQFLFDLYAGGIQLQSVYGLYILDEEFKTVYYNAVNNGTKYTDTDIAKIEAELVRTAKNLKDKGIVGDYSVSTNDSISNQTDENKVQGIFIASDKKATLQYNLSSVKYSIEGVI